MAQQGVADPSGWDSDDDASLHQLRFVGDSVKPCALRKAAPPALAFEASDGELFDAPLAQGAGESAVPTAFCGSPLAVSPATMCGTPARALPRKAIKQEAVSSDQSPAGNTGVIPDGPVTEPADIASGWDSDDPASPRRISGSRERARIMADPCGAQQRRGCHFVSADGALGFGMEDDVSSSLPCPVETKRPANCEEIDDLLRDLDDIINEAPLPSANAVLVTKLVPDFQCTNCDFQVLWIADHIWTDDAEYIFFRNYYPDFAKLRQRLRPMKECAAYCCQCSWKSAEADAPLIDVASGLRWRVIISTS